MKIRSNLRARSFLGCRGPAVSAQAAENLGAVVVVNYLAHEDHAVADHGVVQRADGGGCIAGVGEGHVAAALGTRRAWHQNDLGVGDLADGPEVVFQVLPRRLPSQVANEYLGCK